MSTRARGVFLEPGDIGIIGRLKVVGDVAALLQGRHGAYILPLLDLGMAVGEGKAGGAMMITGGQIEEAGAIGLVRPPAHVGGEISHVNAVLAHVQEYKDL